MSEVRTGIGARIFFPVIWLMDRLGFAAKFALIALFVLAPLAVVQKINIGNLNDQYEFNWKEHLGVEYMNPVKDFMFAVQRHRIFAVAVMQGDRSFEADLSASVADADRAAGLISQIDAKPAPKLEGTYGDVMKSTDYWKRIQAEWESLKGQKFASASDADAAHEVLTGKITDFILNYIANYSNLILDPDLDSYWLMDAFVGKLPTITQTVSKSTTIAMLLSTDESKRLDRSIDLAGYFKVETGTMADLRDINMATAFKETQNFGKSATLESGLKAPLSRSFEAVNNHGTAIRDVFAVTGPRSLADNRSIARQSIDTLKDLYALWDGVSPELDSLCKVRAEVKYGSPRTSSYVISALIVLVLLSFFGGLYLSIKLSVDALGLATRNMVRGSTETFKGRSADELGSVFEQYNQINGALTEARTLRAKVEQDNQELQDNIMDLLRVVSTASDGDLTTRARVTAGALGNVSDAFNQLLEALQALIGDIKQQQQRTTDAVASIRGAAQTMAQGATQQTKELQSATQLVERMSAEIERVSENARTAAEAAKRTESSAIDGTKAVDDVISGMDQLRANVQSGTKKMKTLGERSMEITSIVNVINRISEQTNMLALNAAIEAARAGEHGRGFSVVAEEVRKLAERTAGATQEIDKLVKAIQSETNETVSAIEVQTEVVEKESAIVGQAGASLTRIKEVSTTSAGLVNEISKVAQKQVDGTRSIVKVMEQISAISLQTQTGAQSTASSVGELVKTAEALDKSIRRFRLN